MYNKIIKKLAPELNFLLTEPPFDTEAGLDFGWFCKEHSFCTFIVSALLKKRVVIVRGDIFIFSENTFGQFLTTMTTSDDHSWCKTSNSKILDLSVSLDCFEGYPKLDKPIFNPGFQNKPYKIKFIPNSFDINADHGDKPFIGYTEKIIVHHTTKELIMNPLLFLHTTESYYICLSICVHCYYLIVGEEKSIINSISQAEAIGSICNKYCNPAEHLLELLQKNT